MAQQYLMKGNPETRRLDKYHMIMALTRACNLGKCRQCYVEGIQKSGSPNGAMEPETVKRALRQFAAVAEKESNETAIAHFKGGEPLVYSHLEEVALFASSLGLEVFITTNGLAVAERIGLLERIQNACGGNLRVTLSLNGSKPEVDALLRVDPAYYHATVKAANALAAAGITFDINHVVHEGNIGDMPGMVALAKEIGASQLNILQLILAGRAASGDVRKAGPEQLLKALFAVYDDGDENTRALMAGSLPDIIGQMKRGECGKGCVAGYRGLLYLKSDGRAFSCPSTANTANDEFLAGNINSSGVRELMDSDALAGLRELKIGPGCKGDILSGGEQAEKLRQAIESMVGEAETAIKNFCVQKNF